MCQINGPSFSENTRISMNIDQGHWWIVTPEGSAGPRINYYLCSGKGNIDLGEWRKRGLMTGIFLVIKMKWEREKRCWIQTPDASQGASAYVKAVDLYIDWLTAIASCKANIKSPAQQSKFNVSKRRSWLLALQRNYLLLKSKSLQSNTSFTCQLCFGCRHRLVLPWGRDRTPVVWQQGCSIRLRLPNQEQMSFITLPLWTAN